MPPLGIHRVALGRTDCQTQGALPFVLDAGGWQDSLPWFLSVFPSTPFPDPVCPDLNMNCSPHLPLAPRALRLLPCALLALLSSHAQTTPTPSAPDAKTLAKYDKNNNSRLDADELAAQRADEARTAAAVAPKSAAPSASGEEIVALSPFEVSTGDENGYAASNSLSGTRLNSKLEDLAGSVSVITKQQLLDTAAIDINDIFLYEVGTEGTGQFTDLSGDGRGDYDNVAGNPTGANRMRGLSAANIAVNGFAASSSIPIDTYNLAGIEIARGANSSLAGVGEAGGTVNLIQNQSNTNRNTTSFSLRADSYGGFRGTIDLNRPLIRNKLALRFSAAYEEKGYVRKPSLDRTDRQTIGFTYRPFPRTTVSGSYEFFSQWARRANSVTPRDTITTWKAAGSPTWDWTTATFTVNGVRQARSTNFDNNRPAGIIGLGSANVRVLQFIDDGRINYMMRGGLPSNTANAIQQFSRSSDIAAAGPLFKVAGTTNKAIYDWTEYNLGAPNYEMQDAGVANARLQQGIYDSRRLRLNAELAWRREEQDTYTRSFIAQQDGVGNTLAVDTNEYLLDGRKNPFLGRPFIGGVNPQVFKKYNFADNFRAQLAAQIDLTGEKNLLKWLGRHNANGYGEYRVNLRAPSMRYHDVLLGQNFNPTLNANGTVRNQFNNNDSLVYPLYYFGKTPGGGVEYANTGPTNPNGNAVASYSPNINTPYIIDGPVQLEEAFFSAQSIQKKKNRTMGGTLQSFFLRDSIVTTFGHRKDKAYTVDALSGGTVINGFLDDSNLMNFGLNKRWREGKTSTKGVVVRPLQELPFVRRAAESTGLTRFFGQAAQGLGVFYNDSQNFSPADAAYNLYLQELPNPTGKSHEYGFYLNLFDRKLNIRVTRQETLQEKTRAGTGVIATRALSIDFDIPGQTRNFDLYQTVREWYLGNTTTLGLRPDFTEDQVRNKAAEVMRYSRSFLDEVTSGGRTIADSSDAKSTGTEVEIQFNPTRYWTLRATGGQQRAIETGISVFIQQFIQERLPVWESIRVPTELRPDGTQLPNAGAAWFTSRLTGDLPQSYFLTNVEQPVNLAIANQGKIKTQGREYTANFTTRYQLAGLFGDHAWLKNVSVGGSYRWASKAVIGYLAGAPDADGVVRKLDRNRPVHDKATGNLDVLLGYNTRLFSNKVRTNFQLNIRNATESGRLQGVGVNPDGKFWQYRIIDPRQFIFTTSFDL